MKYVLNHARKIPTETRACSFGWMTMMPSPSILLNAFALLLSRLQRAYRGQSRRSRLISLSGYIAEPVQEINAFARSIDRRSFPPGLGMYVGGGCDLTIMNFAHQKDGPLHAGRFITRTRPMWVRTLNGFNDSPKARKGKLKLEILTREHDQVVALNASRSHAPADMQTVLFGRLNTRSRNSVNKPAPTTNVGTNHCDRNPASRQKRAHPNARCPHQAGIAERCDKSDLPHPHDHDAEKIAHQNEECRRGHEASSQTGETGDPAFETRRCNSGSQRNRKRRSKRHNH